MKQCLLLIVAIVITGCYSRGNNSVAATKVVEEAIRETPEEIAANNWSSNFYNSDYCLFTTGLCTTGGMDRPPLILVFHAYSYSSHHCEGVATLAYWQTNYYGYTHLFFRSRYKYKFHNNMLTLFDGEHYARGWQANPYSRGEDGTLKWDSQTNSINGRLIVYNTVCDIDGSEYEYDITPWASNF